MWRSCRRHEPKRTVRRPPDRGRPIRLDRRRAARRARPQRAAHRARKIPALPYRRVAAAVHLRATQAAWPDRADARLGVHQEIQRPVRLHLRQGIAAVLLQHTLRRRRGTDMAGAALRVRPDAARPRPRQGRQRRRGNRGARAAARRRPCDRRARAPVGRH